MPSGEGVLIDSVILIDHLNGVGAATEFLDQPREGLFHSPVTRAEVLSGVDDSERPAVVALLDDCPLLAIGAAEGDLAARLRREHRWKLPDALQAAVALQHGLVLATRNTRDFPPETHGFVRAPYTLGTPHEP